MADFPKNVSHFYEKYKNEDHMTVSLYDGYVIIAIADDNLSDYDNGNVYSRSICLPFEIFDISNAKSHDYEYSQYPTISFEWFRNSSNWKYNLIINEVGMCYYERHGTRDREVLIGWDEKDKHIFLSDDVIVVTNHMNELLKRILDQIWQYHLEYFKRG
ncbi:hypothetical protein phiOC_p308 [Ochrobactrum phage vB_OspM_OC]|nr:hypothetical protein phiOC_p308 [Ochrobactrum phage vB_OspM_OC]